MLFVNRGAMTIYDESGPMPEIIACTCETDVCLLHKAAVGIGYWPVQKIPLEEFHRRYPKHPAINSDADPVIRGVDFGWPE